MFRTYPERIRKTGYVFLGPDTFPLAEDQPDIIIIISSIIISIISIVFIVIIHIIIIIMMMIPVGP